MLPTLALVANLTVGIHAQLAAPLPRIPLPRAAATVARAATNTNYKPAGALRNGVLTLAIDIVESAWRPEGDTEPEVPILAFAERGMTPVNPGPLIRARQGTEVRLTLRNRSDSAITIGGTRPGVSSVTDTLTLPAGGSRELRFRLDSVGTFWYWGAFGGTSWLDRLWKDSQLNGAIVVEPPGGSPSDHVFVLAEWFHPYSDERRPFEVVSLINGKAFPHTQRLNLRQGDSTHFRVINTIPLHHPMHLHGFYYRVSSRGDGSRDTPIAPGLQPLLNTDLLAPGRTMTLSFLPTTPGNWLFHCHFSLHMDETVTLAGSPRDSADAMHDSHAAAPGTRMEHTMRGLVVGIHVAPSGDHREYSAPNARDIRLLVQKKAGRLIGGTTAFGFVVQQGDKAPARDSVSLPGPILELVRAQPVRITVVNNLEEPTGIHWHGLEIESFPDGVAGWSGLGKRIMPPVAPGDSFVAEFTPPRSGTYPYHSHLNERHQILSGMYGAIIVTDQPRDTVHDHLVVAGGGGPEIFKKIESPYALVNGRRFPPPMRLTVGEKHRLRLLSIHPDWRVAFSIRTDSSVGRWRAIAKDGADLPPALATDRPAYVEMGPGETADFEFESATPGQWRFEVKSVETGWYIPFDIIVAERAKARR